MALSLPFLYYTWHVKYFTYSFTYSLTYSYLLMQVRANLIVLVLGFTVLDLVWSLTVFRSLIVLVLVLVFAVLFVSLPLTENCEQLIKVSAFVL